MGNEGCPCYLDILNFNRCPNTPAGFYLNKKSATWWSLLIIYLVPKRGEKII
jgi:hypothetical protein